jgi:hypothetical protein
MQLENLNGNGDEPPSGNGFNLLKKFQSAGRGFWRDVADADWNDWRWQLKHRITNADQLQRLMPTRKTREHKTCARHHAVFFQPD